MYVLFFLSLPPKKLDTLLKVLTWLTLLVIDLVLYLCVLVLYTMVSIFFFQLMGSHGAALLVHSLLFLIILFFLCVTAEFLLGWFLIVFWVHLLEFPWIILHDRHPQKFCIGVWSIWLGWNFNLGLLLVHLLEFLLARPPDCHPRRYCWGGCFSKYLC